MDWDISYRTIDDRVQAVSQLAFLRNLARGEAYQAEAPALWDVTFGTAVAQAEIEDRETPGTFIKLAFAHTDRPGTERGGCALAAADQARWSWQRPGRNCCLPAWHWSLIPTTSGTARCSARRRSTPLFDVQVPILAHRLADPAKGTGLVMVCTFGDMTDVTWWRDLQLETRPVIGKDGRLRSVPPPGSPARRASPPTSSIGRPARQGRQAAGDRHAARGRAAARRARADPARGEVLRVWPGTAGDHHDPPVVHPQWQPRRRTCANALLDRGRELHWHPEHMRTRYEHWVEGLTGDWLISRQRYTGRADPGAGTGSTNAAGSDAGRGRSCPRRPTCPSTRLPTCPPGTGLSSAAQPGGFAADPDVMDTWATSSLTPQIAGGLARPTRI